MKEIPLSQGKTALVDDEDYDWLSQWKWYAVKMKGKFWYASRKENNPKRHAVFMHREIMMAPKGMDIDHHDGNGLNNTRKNLRVCTRSENACNRRLPIINTTGYKGVTWNKLEQKYKARIVTNGKGIHLGYFSDPLQAAFAYDEAAKKYHGEFAKLNFED